MAQVVYVFSTRVLNMPLAINTAHTSTTTKPYQVDLDLGGWHQIDQLLRLALGQPQPLAILGKRFEVVGDGYRSCCVQIAQ